MSGLVIVAVVAALAEAVLHWFPWQFVMGRNVPPPWSYVAGLLPIMAVAWAYTLVQGGDALGASLAWTVAIAAGGFAVLLAYLVDGYLAERGKRMILEADDAAEED